MTSALLRKSVTDLSRRRARTFFAAATLALAVASIGIFAMPALMDRSMQAEVSVREARRPDRLHEPARARRRAAPSARRRCRTCWPSSRAPASPAGSTSARAGRPCTSSASATSRGSASTSSTSTRARAPRAGEVLTDVQNGNQGVLGAGIGATVQSDRRRRLGARRSGSAARAEASRAANGSPTTTSSSSTRRLRRSPASAAAPTTARSPSGSPTRGRPRSPRRSTAVRGSLRARPGLHPLHRPARTCARRATGRARQDFQRFSRLLLRDHRARAAVGAGADREHDDDPRRRADRRRSGR